MTALNLQRAQFRSGHVSRLVFDLAILFLQVGHYKSDEHFL